MARRLLGPVALVAAAHLLLVSTTRVATANHAHGTGGGSALRELVRGLGDGTALGPAMDAIAALGTTAVWQQVGLLFVGVGGVCLLAFGPAVAMVAFHWTYRRVRWLFWVVLSALVRAGRAAWAGTAIARRLVGDSTATGATEDTPPATERSESVAE
jgi:hypothetical protein